MSASIVLIDGYYLVARSRYAFPYLYTSYGLPSGILFGFWSQILSLSKTHSASEIKVCWDTPYNWRRKLDKNYKAQRHLVYDSSGELNDVVCLLTFLGIDQYTSEDNEADDIIATLIMKSPNQAYKIISSDHDLMALLREGVTLCPNSKTSYSLQDVQTRYGVEPKKLPLLRAFLGDRSDNLKGVPRVNKTSMQKIVSECTSLDHIYTYLSTELGTPLTKKDISSLYSNRELVYHNYFLLQLKTDVPLELHPGVFSEDSVRKIALKYEIRKEVPYVSVRNLKKT